MIRVKCSLCNGTDESCVRCLDGTEDIYIWHANRGLKIPNVIHLDSGYYRISFGREDFAQFPDNLKGFIPDKYIFQPTWNRHKYQNFEIV